jgi:hypothetical protein
VARDVPTSGDSATLENLDSGAHSASAMERRLRWLVGRCIIACKWQLVSLQCRSTYACGAAPSLRCAHCRVFYDFELEVVQTLALVGCSFAEERTRTPASCFRRNVDDHMAWISCAAALPLAAMWPAALYTCAEACICGVYICCKGVS